MSRAARFDLAWLAVAALVIGVLVWALWIPSSPVSSPGDGGVPAVTGTVGTSSP
jgi:hypothetical protein